MATHATTAGPGPATNPGAEVTTVVFLVTGSGVLASEEGTAMWRSVPTPPSGEPAPTAAQLRRARRAHPAFQGRLPSADAASEPGAGPDRGPSELGTVEIYDPMTASWSAVPPGVRQAKVGEAFCSVLADGRFLIGGPAAGPVATYDPTTRQWSTAVQQQVHGRHGGKASSFIAVRLRT